MTEVESRRISKSKISLILAVTLVVILTISSIWMIVKVYSLQIENDSLQTSVGNLQTEVSRLASKKNSLENQINTLTEDNDDLQSEIDYLTTINDYLQSRVDTLTEQNDNLLWEINDAQFYFYYVLPEEQNFGVYDLEDELYGLEWIDQYEEGVFDCSEMSAYIEWDLENKGWHTTIVAGDSPFGSGKHAWLLVETSEGKYMPVESTNIEIVWWENPNFDDYFVYDRSFETILEAIAYNESEFDWWI